jgi:hypothetical protein
MEKQGKTRKGKNRNCNPELCSCLLLYRPACTKPLGSHVSTHTAGTYAFLMSVPILTPLNGHLNNIFGEKISQCFDSMWYEETMNDMWYSMDVRDDKCSLIREMNRLVDLFVKTPVGDSEIFTVEKIEQQGTVLAPLKCSNQMDSIPRECLSENIEMFRYRNAVSIPPVGMIDDLASIA